MIVAPVDGYCREKVAVARDVGGDASAVMRLMMTTVLVLLIMVVVAMHKTCGARFRGTPCLMA